MNEDQILKLREILLNEFSEAELTALCKDVGLDYATLSGEGQFGKTREIIKTLIEQDKVQALRSRVRDLKPIAFNAAGFNAAANVPESNRKLPTKLAWLVLGLVGLLLLVCLLTFLLRPNTPAAPSATPTAQAEVNPTSVAANAPAAQPTVAATQAPTQPPPLTNTLAPPTAVPTQTPAPTNTPTVSETNPAALAILEFNQQLIPYYQGKAVDKSLTGWTGNALRGVVAFSKGSLLKRLSITENERSQINSGVTYLLPPAVTRVVGNTYTVTSREYWVYQTNPRNVVCETRDYTYTVVKTGEKFQIAQSTGKPVSAKCS
jgi:hypothetical protein